MAQASKSAYVIVVGDVGRSPRMCNHATSLAGTGEYDVTLLGHCQSEVRHDVKSHPRIALHHIPTYTLHTKITKIPRLLNYVFKVIWQALTLWFALPLVQGPDVILLQNPPGVPALIVCYLYSLLHRTQFVIDWHNYGYSIMALSIGEDHFLVRLSRGIEEFVGKRVAKSFCVSKAMKRDLGQNMGVQSGVSVLYDRPGAMFRPCAPSESSNLFSKLAADYPEVSALTNDSNSSRPAVLVSSTSWTEDEDFSILVEALQAYEESANSGKRLPDLVCIITGKGPLKDHYLGVIRDHDWKRVTVVTPWLEPEDYPTVLASADLGVSLHTSSSGVDLPMKVVDMFGCGLPVAAKRFEAIGELVVDGTNGVTFDGSQDLANFITDWFSDFGSEEYRARDAKYRAEVAAWGQERWEETWNKVARPVFD